MLKMNLHFSGWLLPTFHNIDIEPFGQSAYDKIPTFASSTEPSSNPTDSFFTQRLHPKLGVILCSSFCASHSTSVVADKRNFLL
jgi:hypothetical protein